MKLRFFFPIGVALLLAGCGLSDQQKADYASVQRAGVSPAIYDKMMHDDSLSVGDIIALKQANVSDAVVIRYIRDHGTVYVLNSDDFSALHSANVSPSVVDYMTRTGPLPGPYGPGPYYAPPPVAIGVGVGFGGGHWH